MTTTEQPSTAQKIAIGMRCHPTGVFCVSISEMDGQISLLEHVNLHAGSEKINPELLSRTVERVKIYVQQYRERGICGVGIKKIELMALKSGVDDSKIGRLYFEGALMSSLYLPEQRLGLYNTKQINAKLKLSKTFKEYAKAGQMREISGLEVIKGDRQEYMEALSAAQCILSEAESDV